MVFAGPGWFVVLTAVGLRGGWRGATAGFGARHTRRMGSCCRVGSGAGGTGLVLTATGWAIEPIRGERARLASGDGNARAWAYQVRAPSARAGGFRAFRRSPRGSDIGPGKPRGVGRGVCASPRNSIRVYPRRERAARQVKCAAGDVRRSSGARRAVAGRARCSAGQVRRGHPAAGRSRGRPPLWGPTSVPDLFACSGPDDGHLALPPEILIARTNLPVSKALPGCFT